MILKWNEICTWFVTKGVFKMKAKIVFVIYLLSVFCKKKKKKLKINIIFTNYVLSVSVCTFLQIAKLNV